MDDIPASESGISEVEKEAPPTPVSDGQVENISTKHDDSEAAKIESDFQDTQERADELKQEALAEGKNLAQRTQESSKSSKPDQIAPDSAKQNELQTEPTQPISPSHTQSTSRLAQSAVFFEQQRAILRAGLNKEVKKAA